MANNSRGLAQEKTRCRGAERVSWREEVGGGPGLGHSFVLSDASLGGVGGLAIDCLEQGSRRCNRPHVHAIIRVVLRVID